LYGAVSWGLANSFFGAAIDAWGFKIVYVTTVMSFIGCGLTFYLYAREDEALVVGGLGENNECIQERESHKSCCSTNADGSRHFEEEKKFSDEDFDINNTNIHPQNNNPADERQPPQQFSIAFLLQTLVNQPAPALNISYIIALFTLYIGMSVVENLIFLYFEFLGGSNKLCGFTVAVTVLFELPIFHYAPDILKWMESPIWMFQWGCLAYVARVIGYSIIPESHAPWVLLLEPLHGVTIGFVLTGSVAFVDSLMPKGHESSGQGFLSTVMGLGQFVGLCIGGVLEGRVLYRVLAGIVSIGSLVLGIGHRLSVRSTTLEESNLMDVQMSTTTKATVTKKSLSTMLNQTNGKSVKRKVSDVAYVAVEPVLVEKNDEEFEIS
jgi:Na+/melibiose symporter-like transporter